MERRLTNKEYGEQLMQKVRDLKAKGMSGEEAVSQLTEKQYDFLIDNDFDIESLWLEKGQNLITSSSQIGKKQRRLSPSGYNKKYPQDKQDLYNNITKFLESINCEVDTPEKINFRDISFTFNDKKYKINIICPRE